MCHPFFLFDSDIYFNQSIICHHFLEEPYGLVSEATISRTRHLSGAFFMLPPWLLVADSINHFLVRC